MENKTDAEHDSEHHELLKGLIFLGGSFLSMQAIIESQSNQIATLNNHIHGIRMFMLKKYGEDPLEAKETDEIAEVIKPNHLKLVKNEVV
jgi:hypothetical protein